MADWLIWDGGAMTADVVTAVNTGSSISLTTHPVETGTAITDHFIRNPDQVTFDFAMSRQSLKDEDLEWRQTDIVVRESEFTPTGLLAISSAVGGAISAGLSAIGLGGAGPQTKVWTLTLKDPDTNRPKEIYDQLLDLMNGGTEVTFVWQGLVLSGYRLTAVNSSTRAGSGGLVRFSVSGQHVATVQTAQVSLLGGFPTPSILQALPMLNRGKKGVEQVAEDQYERSLGAADIGLDDLGGAF